MNMVKACSVGIALALWLFLVVDARGQPIDIAAAKKEGKVIVYGSVVPQAMEELHKNFELKHGIRVDYWRGSSTAVAERAQSEWRAGRPAFRRGGVELGCHGFNEKGRDFRSLCSAVFT